MAKALFDYYWRNDSGLALGASAQKAVPVKSTKPASVNAAKQTVRALPFNWYTSDKMYDLERRAIFSRKWQLITHKCRFTKPGDWVSYEVANYSFVLCRDREGRINGFHNICRHRAFPVVLEEEGTSQIFSCKYHGWSYGLSGKLAKAPGYRELDEFDKIKNSLFPVHVHIDVNGFIWVNLDAKEVPELSWEDSFQGVDTQARYSIFNFDDYVYDHTWSMDGHYNWKILADNYNECYHCATSHPDIGAVADLQSYSVDVEGDMIFHNPATTATQAQNGMTIASTYVFPNASTNISPHFFMIQRFIPQSQTKSVMRYEVYRNQHSSQSEFETIDALYKRIMSEDKDLCKRAQANLDAGIFVNGEMHPRMEKGPLHFQNLVRENVMLHRERELELGDQIWPARQRVPPSAKTSSEDFEFCSGLAACQLGQEELEW